jgi:hypothetical protein
MGGESPRRTLRRQLFVPFTLALAGSIVFLGSVCFLFFLLHAIENRRIGLAESTSGSPGARPRSPKRN